MWGSKGYLLENSMFDDKVRAEYNGWMRWRVSIDEHKSWREGSLRPGSPSCHAGQDGHDGWDESGVGWWWVLTREDRTSFGRDWNDGGRPHHRLRQCFKVHSIEIGRAWISNVVLWMPSNDMKAIVETGRLDVLKVFFPLGFRMSFYLLSTKSTKPSPV